MFDKFKIIYICTAIFPFFWLSILLPVSSYPNFEIIYNKYQNKYFIGEEIKFEAYIRFLKSDYDNIKELGDFIVFNDFQIDEEKFYIDQTKLFSPSKISFQGMLADDKYFTKRVFSSSFFPKFKGRILLPSLITEIAIENYKVKSDNYKYTSDANYIYIESLPVDTLGLIDKMNSNVGYWDIIDNYSSDSIFVDKSSDFQVTVSGIGNPDPIDIDYKDFPTSFKSLKVDKKNMDVNGFTLSNKIEFNFSFIPSKIGDFIIPSIRIDYFDPRKKIWIKKQTDEREIHVFGPKNKDNYIREVILSILLLISLILFIKSANKKSLK